MTVKELKMALKGLPGETHVCVQCTSSSGSALLDVRTEVSLVFRSVNGAVQILTGPICSKVEPERQK